MTSFRFTLPEGGGKRRNEISSVTIREVTGEDEMLAEANAEAKAGKGNSGLELVRLSIVEIDDEPVAQPFTQLDRYNTRTRKFIVRGFEAVNGFEEEEMDDFLASAAHRVEQAKAKPEKKAAASVSSEPGAEPSDD